jgi:hypothetical protein
MARLDVNALHDTTEDILLIYTSVSYEILVLLELARILNQS